MNFEKVVEIQIKEIEKLKQALAVAEDALEDIGHDQDMIRIRGDLASEYNSWANEALEKIQCIKEGEL